MRNVLQHLLENRVFMKELKHSFITAPILVLLDPACQFIVEVDVSETGVGAILS